VENLSLVEGDLADRDFVLQQLLETYEPDTVLHAAAQPSAPYSSINGERALYTQRNNVSMNLNLLHGLAERARRHALHRDDDDGHLRRPALPDPGGGMEVERKDGSDEVPFPAMGGSWYHQTKSFDAANMRLAGVAVRVPDERGSDRDRLRDGDRRDTGAREPDAVRLRLLLRTVVNRFCAQAVAGYPITVYGKGEQRKPMVSLEDTVESLVRLVEEGHSGDDGIDIYNQVTRPVAIVELAETIAEVGDEFDLDAEVKHYENPRNEDEEHKMEMENDRFLDLVGGQQQTLEGESATCWERSSTSRTGSPPTRTGSCPAC